MTQQEKATFAGGCFWCTQADFEKVDGVVATTVGYTGGTVPQPTYEMVCEGTTGHVEALEICFQPDTVSYVKLLEIYFKGIEPERGEGQFSDTGPQYRPVIFYHSEAQKKEAESFLAAKASHKPLAVRIEAARPFYSAEEYHQHYAHKNPVRYIAYRNNSGRSH